MTNQYRTIFLLQFSNVDLTSHISDVEPIRAIKDDLILIDCKASEVLFRLINVLRVIFQNLFYLKLIIPNVPIKELCAIVLDKKCLSIQAIN